MEIQALMHVKAELKPEEYKDLVDSIDTMYATYVRHFPKFLEEIAPIMAFKNALVLESYEKQHV